MESNPLTRNVIDDSICTYTWEPDWKLLQAWWTAQNADRIDRIPNPKVVPSGNLDAILVEQLELLLVSCYGHPEKCDCAFCGRMFRVKRILMEIFE